MKYKFFALTLVGALAALGSGCDNKTAPGNPPPNAPAKAAAPKGGFVSVNKTSFNEVTAQLDPGGQFYMYLGTAQWLDGLSTRLGAYQQAVLALPDLPPDAVANVNKGFAIASRLIKDSGLEDISGLGMSSIEIENGLYRNKALLHHYPGKGGGFLWQLLGAEPHPLTGLDLLPANTALANFADVNVPLLWNVVKKEVAQANVPQAQAWLDQLPVEFERSTKVKWDDFLKSLGGEIGFVLTLDPSNNIPLPLPNVGAISLPTPGLMLAIKVNDEMMFNRIDRELKANPQVSSMVFSKDQPGVKMRTMNLPIPFLPVRPTAASTGGYLLIASTDDLINEALAVKAGQKPGLKATEEFKRLSQNVPDRGNNFTFLSRRFTETLMQVQQQFVAAAGSRQNPKMGEWLQTLPKGKPAFGYTVGANTPEGNLVIGNSSQSQATALLLPAAAVSVAAVSAMSAIAIPNFVKARTVAQENACINNLRQLDSAKQQWALENKKPANAVPTKADLMPYLSRWPVCPQGGTYTIGSMTEPPSCNIHGHEEP